MKTLQDKYLPGKHFSSKASILVDAKPKEIYPFIRELDFSDSRITYFLFKLRGIPVPESMNLKGLEKLNFYKLEEIENRAIIIGLIGKFWTVVGNLQSFSPEEFIPYSNPDLAKATWEFRIIPLSENLCRTETRIKCLSKSSEKKFIWYWMFIKPFSGFTRYEILRSIRRKIRKEYSEK